LLLFAIHLVVAPKVHSRRETQLSGLGGKHLTGSAFIYSSHLGDLRGRPRLPIINYQISGI